MSTKRRRNRGQRNRKEFVEGIKRNTKQTDVRDLQILGDVSTTDPSVGVSQRNVVKIVAPLSKPDFVKLAAVWPLFAVKNSIPNDLMEIDQAPDWVGQIYLMYVGIAYDLYLASRNQVSMFTVMPRKYKELRDAFLPKAVGGTSYEWLVAPTCYESGGFINTLLPFVDFASLSWPVNIGGVITTGPLQRLYDFNFDGAVVIPDSDVFNLTPNIIQAIWTNLNKRVDIDLIAPSVVTGYEGCCGLFSQSIDLSYIHNLGWIGSIIEEIVPNSQYWTRFLSLVIITDDPTTRTGIHIMNDYRGPHHYACHLEKYDYDEQLQKTVKTLYRPKTFSLEEIAVYLMTMLLEGDLYALGEEMDLTPSNNLQNSMFLSMSQSQFLRYILVLAFTRFTQEGWTTFAFETCDAQTTLVGGVNLTPYSDTYNMTIPRAVAEYFGSIGVKISTYRSGKNGYRIVEIPQLAVYGNTLANVYQNQAYQTTSTVPIAANLASLLEQMNPQSTPGSYTFSVTGDNSMPDAFNVDVTITLTSISVSQVVGDSVVPALQQVGDSISAMKGFVTMSTNIANKDDVPFTVLYYTRIIEEPVQFGNFSGIYTVAYTNLTNRVNFDQRIIGNHMGVPLPITCMPRSLHQIIYSEHSVSEVNNEMAFFLLTIRSALSFAHPKESTSDTTDLELLNKTNSFQSKGGNFFKAVGEGLKWIWPQSSKVVDSVEELLGIE
jgi:hypothetical protein